MSRERLRCAENDLSQMSRVLTTRSRKGRLAGDLSSGQNMAVRKPAAHRGSGTDAERSAPPPTAMIRLDVIGLIVADLLRSIAFYEQLGLQFQENPDAEGHVMSRRPFGVESVSHSTPRSRSGRSIRTGHHPQAGTGRRSPSSATRRRMSTPLRAARRSRSAGLQVALGFLWGQRYAQVKDPDWNVVDLFAPISGSA
jgi:catechol 2,3-dioxygenase-like lactoylglutathione lyase family enzyme